MNVIDIIRWFNDFKKGYIRFRMCERCYKITRNVHWSKTDTAPLVYSKSDGKITRPWIYGHIWLCDHCFYGQLLGLK